MSDPRSKDLDETSRYDNGRLRALLETVSQGIQENDLEGTITFSNPAHARMLGYAPGELVGKKIWELVHDANERAKLEAYLGHLIAEQPEPTPYRTTSRRKDGSGIDTQVEWAYRRDGSGRLIGFISVISDITERQRAEEALRRASERYRQLFEEAPVMYVISREKGGRGFIEDCNRNILETLGYERHELLGRPIYDLYSPPSQRALNEGGYERALSGEFLTEERQLLTKSGEVVDTLLRAVPERDGDGRVIGTRAMYVDITEQRLLERQLRQSQKMEALGRLAGGIAHDFNNLLTAILGYCDLLRASSHLDPDQLRGLAEIRNAGTRAAALTHQLLAFTRQRTPTPTTLDLNDVVSEISTLLRRTIGEDIELVTRLDPSLELVRADHGQIEQVLLNLAVNARDAMPEGGTLEIITFNRSATRRAGLGAVSPRSVRLRVRDTGMGMSAETRERLFEPFFTTKPEGQGTGQGLATVYGIVNRYGGTISVTSEPGQGSQFDLSFPAMTARAEDEEAPAPAARTPRAATILLVEDDPAVLGLAAQILATQGHEVLTTDAPGAALELCRAHGDRIDLLLTDVRLPEFSGRQLAARVQELFPGMRVVLMSGFEETDGADPDPSLGEVPFVAKPFGADALLEAIAEALGTEKEPPGH